MTGLKKIPIGREDFKEIIDKNCYFVDKTMLIREIVESGSKVTLFTRPRRFGKTLNMSMLRRYFEKTEQDNSYLFDGLKISETDCQEYMGKYPVISISLKSLKQSSFDSALSWFRKIICDEFDRHREILLSEIISDGERLFYYNILNKKCNDDEFAQALNFLSNLLKKVYKENVIILIDEYDVPLENAFISGYYDKMVSLIRSVFESVLKTNDSLELAVLTGCLRVSKESIFTGLNNLDVNSIKSVQCSEYFGFTESEVQELVDYYGIISKIGEIKKWYDGYMFGKTEIYNPWSVLNYIKTALSDEDAIAEQYWSNTSSNDIIHELIVKGDRRTKNDVETLITGGTIEKPLYDDITYNNIDVNSEYVWSFLLHTGYLKPVKYYKNGVQSYFTAVIPNTEIVTVYENTFRKWFDESIRVADKSILLNAVLSGDAETFEQEVNKWLLRSISYHDGYENFYHGFLVGLLEYSEDYLVESNREQGTGRSDIIIKDIIKKEAVIIEIKSVRKGETLSGQCDYALEQIDDRCYDVNIGFENYKKIIKYGVAFYEKQCMVKIK